MSCTQYRCFRLRLPDNSRRFKDTISAMLETAGLLPSFRAGEDLIIYLLDMMTSFPQLSLTMNQTCRPISILRESSVFKGTDDVAGNSIPINSARLLGDRTHEKDNHPVAGSGCRIRSDDRTHRKAV